MRSRGFHRNEAASSAAGMTQSHEAKEKLIDAGRVLAHQGQGDMTRGHVSVRVPGEPALFFMKPHSVGLDEISMENILTINFEGEVVAGTSRRHSEVYVHSARPDVQALIHTHSTHAVTLSCTGRPILPISQGGAAFAGAVPVFARTIDLIRSPELGRTVAEALPPIAQFW